jgi:bifunctional ADP-heptose synthase (sugar kinase/adenylyltransferase)
MKNIYSVIKKIRNKNKKIFVIGELIFDYNFFIQNIGKSLEKNIPKFEIEKELFELGGAGKIYFALKKIIQKNAYFVSAINKKKTIEKFDKNIFFYNHNFNNIIKNRYWKKNKKVFQINQDNKNKFHFNKGFNKFTVGIIKKNLKKISAIIIGDYKHGLIDKKLISTLIKICKNNNIKIYLDAQIRSLNHVDYRYSNVDFLVFNFREFNLYKKKFNITGDEKKSLLQIKKKLDLGAVVLKKGSKGSSILNDKFNYYQSRAFKGKKIIDVVGAGDYFIAMLAALNNNYHYIDILKFSNYWAFEKISSKNLV